MSSERFEYPFQVRERWFHYFSCYPLTSFTLTNFVADRMVASLLHALASLSVKGALNLYELLFPLLPQFSLFTFPDSINVIPSSPAHSEDGSELQLTSFDTFTDDDDRQQHHLRM